MANYRDAAISVNSDGSGCNKSASINAFPGRKPSTNQDSVMSDSVSFRLVRDGDVEWRVQSILGRHRMPSMRGATVLEVLESATESATRPNCWHSLVRVESYYIHRPIMEAPHFPAIERNVLPLIQFPMTVRKVD